MIPITGFLDKQDPLPKLGARVEQKQAAPAAKPALKNDWRFSTLGDDNGAAARFETLDPCVQFQLDPGPVDPQAIWKIPQSRLGKDVGAETGLARRLEAERRLDGAISNLGAKIAERVEGSLASKWFDNFTFEPNISNNGVSVFTPKGKLIDNIKTGMREFWHNGQIVSSTSHENLADFGTLGSIPGVRDNYITGYREFWLGDRIQSEVDGENFHDFGAYYQGNEE